jgi:ABC-type antimicrobial peptide transport system permease subunit
MGSGATRQAITPDVGQLDPELAVADVRAMDQIAVESVASQRFALFLAGLFALLATIGIYGVISYTVDQRMSEFGLRMALGATSRDLLRLILSQSLKLLLAGAATGLLCAAAVAPLLRSLLYGVTGADPLTFGGVAALALATALLAGYLPARRAAQVDPMRSLRSE